MFSVYKLRTRFMLKKPNDLILSSNLTSLYNRMTLFPQVESMDCSPVESWSVVFSPSGRHVATGNHAGKINIYSVAGGELVTTLDTRGRFTYTIAYVGQLLRVFS